MTHQNFRRTEVWQQIVQALGLSVESGAAFGLTPEETQAHLDAFKDAGTVGGDAFLAAVEREKTIPMEQFGAAEQLRLEARRNVAMVIEEFFTTEALASFDGPPH